MYKKIMVSICFILVLPWLAHAYDSLSFDIDWIHYQDEYRTFEMDFSQGIQGSYGDLDMYDTWSSNTGSGTNPDMNFHPSDGDGPFFNIDTTTGRYRVSIPKPLDRLPAMTAAASTDWATVSAYIDEGAGIDFRGGNASANIETVKLAYNSDKSRMKLFFKITDETDLSNIGFRFVFFPMTSGRRYGYSSYLENNYPSGAPKYLIVDLDEITDNAGTVKLFKITDEGVKTPVSGTLPACTRSGNTFEVTFGIVNNDATIIDLAAEDFLMEGVSFSDPDGTPQLQDTFGPRFPYSRAGGEFTATAGYDFDGQATSMGYTVSARLTNFDAFSSDCLNEFRFGMYGNAVAGYNDAPQVSISGKWVSGFYNGKRYDASFLFESRVFDNQNSVSGVWLTNDAMEVPGVSPETAVIDIAMQTAENGMRINLYYRVSTTGDEPTDIATIDTTWTLFNTYEITSDRPFFGYPVNKGVIFVGSDAISYPVDVPAWGNADNNAEIVGSDMGSESATDLESQYNLTDFLPIAPKESVELTCDPGEKVVLRYLINGFHKELNKLRLYKLKNGNHLSFKDYVSYPVPGAFASGDWWITVLGADPVEAIDGLGELEKDVRYVLYFVVQDNDGQFDLDETAGRILDPTVIGEYSGATDSADADGSSDGGSGGGGCFLSSIVY